MAWDAEPMCRCGMHGFGNPEGWRRSSTGRWVMRGWLRSGTRKGRLTGPLVRMGSDALRRTEGPRGEPKTVRGKRRILALGVWRWDPGVWCQSHRLRPRSCPLAGEISDHPWCWVPNPSFGSGMPPLNVRFGTEPQCWVPEPPVRPRRDALSTRFGTNPSRWLRKPPVGRAGPAERSAWQQTDPR